MRALFELPVARCQRFFLLTPPGDTMNKQKVAYVLGGGILGLWSAFWLLRKGFKVYIIDRNQPFAGFQSQQTSHAGIGIVEVPHMKPLEVTTWAYHETRRIYAWLMRRGLGHIQKIMIRYVTNEDGYLDGPYGRAPDERYEKLKGKDLLGYKYGERFENFLVPTTMFNHAFRRFLFELGVEFIQREISEHPGVIRMPETEEPSVVYDCRGMGLVPEQIGCTQRSKSGQTLLVWAPPEVLFDEIIGNPNSDLSFNIVPWGKVTKELIRILALETQLSPSDGGQILVLGGSKFLDVNTWEPMPPVSTAIFEGCLALDSRISRTVVMRERMGHRAILSQGVYDQSSAYGERYVRWLGGAAGNSYCFMPAYIRLRVRQTCRELEMAQSLAMRTSRMIHAAPGHSELVS